MNKKENTCSTCKHWKNQQMLLNYSDSTGFCTNPRFQFNTMDGRLIGVVDTENLRNREQITGNCANNFEVLKPNSVVPSRYLLQTEKKFGCIFHTLK